MNDAVFVSCAQALARQMAAHGSDAQARITYGFQRCLARPPDAEELAELEALDKRAREIYYAEPSAGVDVAGKLALRDLTAPQAAAYAVVARTILNLDEVVTRE
jgi:hypothetical protein